MMGEVSAPVRRTSSWSNDGYSSAPVFTKPQPRPQVSSVSFDKRTVQSTHNIPGNYEIHDVHELSVGMKIEHSRFGIGQIELIDKGGSDAKIKVWFNELNETKLLMLKFAKFKIVR